MSRRKKQYSGPKDSDFYQLATSIAAISKNIELLNSVRDRYHACQTISIQLRKLLLDKAPLIQRCYGRNTFKFHPIVKVPMADKPFHTPSIQTVEGGYLEFRLANQDGTPNPDSIPERVTIAPSSAFVQIYPLPGVSHDAHSNRVILSVPFDLKALPLIPLHRWLAQKVVSICGHDMTLQDILKTIADEEGAHARDFSTDKESKIFIARQFMFRGFSYFHWIVMYTASYLIDEITKFALYKDRLIRASISFHEIAQLEEITMDADSVKSQVQIEMLLHFGDNQPEHKTYYLMKPCENV